MKAGFPRSIRVGRCRVSVYKLCLLAGTYSGIIASAVAAKATGIDLAAMALATLACAAAGLVGARLYHLAVFAAIYRDRGFRGAWDTTAGGGGLFGGLLAVAIVSPGCAAWLGVGFGVFWDILTPALLAGVVCTRFGCFFHGCCSGRATASRFGFRWANHRGERLRRIPVQLLEIAWASAALGAFVFLFPRPRAPGTLALAGLAWYGLGRFFLEPLREEPDLIWGRVRINQLIAGLAVLIAGGLLLLRQTATGPE